MKRLLKRILKPLKKSIEPAAYFFADAVYRLIPRDPPIFKGEVLGLNFIGYSKGEIGLGQAMRSMAWSAKAALIPFLVRQFTVRITSKQLNHSLAAYSSDRCQYPVNLICINPDMLYRLPFWVQRSEWSKTYNIGYWFWELENFPIAWKYALHLVDEIWVATDFIAHAMLKSGKRVVKIPFPLEFDMPPKHLDKAYFDLDPSEYTFLFSFNFDSVSERKNPQAVIAAFQLAFAKSDTPVRLILKTMNGEHYPKFRKLLEDLIGGDPRIQFRDEYLTQDEMRGLTRSVDCYVSLHRAEGLGLGLAEAMYLGKPTIATDYSGNTDFMNSENSILIPYELVPIPIGAYPNGFGQRWAEPNINEASIQMRRLASEKTIGEEIGRRAAKYIRDNHSYLKTGEAIKTELERISRAPGGLSGN